jgi:hypothetical protein
MNGPVTALAVLHTKRSLQNHWLPNNVYADLKNTAVITFVMQFFSIIDQRRKVVVSRHYTLSLLSDDPSKIVLPTLQTVKNSDIDAGESGKTRQKQQKNK